jgi:hypothetical protein
VHFRRVIGEPPPKKKCKAAQEVEILLQHCGNGGTVWVSVMPFHTTMARALAAHQEDAVGPGGGSLPYQDVCEKVQKLLLQSGPHVRSVATTYLLRWLLHIY